ncbi:MAG: protein-L-isoaspartate O-methyltransferase [Pseudomonadota bacterium]
MNTEQARFNMIEQQIRPWDVLDQQVLDLLMTTPRELFVPERYQSLAFTDTQIDIGHNQTMMAPKEEARMLQALKIKPTDSVLEIGTGSGFVTALLAKQAKNVFSTDIIPDFVTESQKKLSHLGINNVNCEVADAASGWEYQAPYDVIVITGSLINLPDSFKNSLKIGGRLFCVLGEAPAMSATLFSKTNENEWYQTDMYETYVAPLINAPKKERFVF